MFALILAIDDRMPYTAYIYEELYIIIMCVSKRNGAHTKVVDPALDFFTSGVSLQMGTLLEFYK